LPRISCIASPISHRAAAVISRVIFICCSPLFSLFDGLTWTALLFRSGYHAGQMWQSRAGQLSLSMSNKRAINQWISLLGHARKHRLRKLQISNAARIVKKHGRISQRAISKQKIANGTLKSPSHDGLRHVVSPSKNTIPDSGQCKRNG
jgi:hypothetical protein